MKLRIKNKIVKASKTWECIIFKAINGMPISRREAKFSLRYPCWLINKVEKEVKRKK